jgi:argininosuccinate lyase
MTEKLWAGRFTQPTDKFVEEFTASISFDQRMYRYDIQGSIAHCRMLAKQGIIAPTRRDVIIAGLSRSSPTSSAAISSSPSPSRTST